MYHSFIKPVYLETALIQLHFDMSGRELILMCGFGSQMLSSERVVECLVFPVYFTFIASSFAISSAGFLIGLIGTMYTLQITPMG